MSEHLTDAVIDALSAAELRDAVARAKGWTNRGAYWYAPGEHDQAFKAWTRHSFHAIDTDTGAALGLLMTISGVSIEWGGMFIIVKNFSGEVATGLITEAASVFCRAFLKLKN